MSAEADTGGAGSDAGSDGGVEKRTRARARRWHMPWSQVIACVIILAGTGIFLYPHIASWFSQKEQSHVVEMSQELMKKPPNNNERYRAEQLERAHRYNDALASGAQLKANERIPVGDGSSSDESLNYNEILAVTDSGFMGRLRYDTLQIDLPIYHGTSEETLKHGVGHLEGTSFPVGGIGTRAVLTAHRGLPTATLFNDLNKAAVGDIITVSVLEQAISYRVVESRVIEPHQTEAVLPDPDRDLITLVTCTPLGVNSHRILVTAERITPTPEDQAKAAEALPDLPGFPWWAVILGAVIVFVVVYVWRSGYPPKNARGKRGAGGKNVSGRKGAGKKAAGREAAETGSTWKGPATK